MRGLISENIFKSMKLFETVGPLIFNLFTHTLVHYAIAFSNLRGNEEEANCCGKFGCIGREGWGGELNAMLKNISQRHRSLV
jgi:hypothetical protein